MSGVEKAEERFVSIGNAGEKTLGCAHRGENRVILNKSPPSALLAFRHMFEQGIQIFHKHHQCARAEVTEKHSTKLFTGYFRIESVDALEIGGWKLLLIADGEIAEDEDQEFKETGRGLILVEPGEAEFLAEVGLLSQAMMNEGNKVGFPCAAGADEKQVMFVFCKNALANEFHAFGQKVMALDEDLLQRLGIGALGGELGDKWAVGHGKDQVRDCG